MLLLKLRLLQAGEFLASGTTVTSQAEFCLTYIDRLLALVCVLGGPYYLLFELMQLYPLLLPGYLPHQQ